MLAKRYRLQMQVRARERGRLQRGRYIFCKTLSATAAHSRFAVVVPSSVLQKASARNFLRRRMYDALASYCKEKTPREVAITVQAAARNAPVRAILEELKQLLG